MKSSNNVDLSQLPEIQTLFQSSNNFKLKTKIEEVSKLIHISELDSYPSTLEQLNELIQMLLKTASEIRDHWKDSVFRTPVYELESLGIPKIYVGTIVISENTPKDVWYLSKEGKVYFCFKRLIGDHDFIYVVIESDSHLGHEIDKSDFLVEGE